MTEDGDEHEDAKRGERGPKQEGVHAGEKPEPGRKGEIGIGGGHGGHGAPRVFKPGKRELTIGAEADTIFPF